MPKQKQKHKRKGKKAKEPKELVGLTDAVRDAADQRLDAAIIDFANQLIGLNTLAAKASHFQQWGGESGIRPEVAGVQLCWTEATEGDGPEQFSATPALPTS